MLRRLQTLRHCIEPIPSIDKTDAYTKAELSHWPGSPLGLFQTAKLFNIQNKNHTSLDQNAPIRTFFCRCHCSESSAQKISLIKNLRKRHVQICKLMPENKLHHRQLHLRRIQQLTYSFSPTVGMLFNDDRGSSSKNRVNGLTYMKVIHPHK